MQKDPDAIIKVVQLASGDLWAGAESQLFQLATSLCKRKDIELQVVLLNDGILAERLSDANVSTTVLDETKTNSLRIFHRFFRILKEFSPDIVHTHRLKENIIGSLASVFVRGCRSIRTVHGLDEFFPAWPHLHRYLYFHLDRIVERHVQFCTVHVSHQLAATRNTNTRRTKVIENGVTLPNDQYRLQRKDLVRPIRILFAGRLVPVKRTDILLETAKALEKRHAGDFEFVIVGDGPLRQSVEEYIRTNSLQKIVRMRGFLDNVVQEMLCSDALLITSDHEGLPMVLLEALACGLPVIASATGGIFDVLAGGRYGELVPDQDVGGYIRALLSLRDNASHFIAKAKRAREMVISNYSACRNAEAYIRLYRELSCKPD